VATTASTRNAQRILAEKPFENYPLRRPTRRCEFNTEVDVRETGYGDGGGWN
jgi:rubredoxin